MSDINKKVQIDVTANGQQAKQEFASTANAAKDMSSTIAQAGGAAASSIDKIGDGAGESAQKVDRASKSMIASIQRATAATQAGGQSTSAYFDAISKQRGLNSDALKPYIDQLRAAEAAQEAARASLGRTGITAAQTAAALRGVPAQFTDIAVSLSSGQAPMTVLLQQGGQLKDMFGGVGNAAKALGGYVASLVTPVTVAAAAIGGIGYAAYAGSTEMDEFKKNLILTGNISGITADKFNAMAQSMANISGITRGAAAEALTAMAASGNIGAESIERLTRSALQFEKAGGPAVADTVKQFEALGKEPVKASVELSEKTHYLTLAVYEQIKSLQEQGKASEAAALAQNAWADAIDKRTPQMVQNLGYIESAWKGIKEAAAGAWDSAKSLGREETDLEKRVALLRKIGQANLDIESGSINSNRLKQQKEQWAQELKALVDSNNAKEAEAKKHAAEEAKNKAQIDAAGKYDKLRDDQMGKAERKKKELTQLEADRAADLISLDRYKQAKADIEKKYEEKAKPNTQAARDEKVYENLLDGLKKQLGVTEKLSAVEKLNIELQEKKYANISPLQKANLQATAQEIDTQKRLRIEGEATIKMLSDSRAAQDKALSGLDDEYKKIARDVATYGKSRAEVAEYDLKLIDEQIAAERELNSEIGVGSSELLRNLEVRRDKQAKILDEGRKLEQLDYGKAAAEKSAKAAEEAARAWEKTVDTIDQTFHDSFTRMLENGKADWNAFGKALATSFKTAVADEIYKLTIKPIVVSVVSSFAGGAAQAAGAVAGQSGSGIGGVVSGVTGAYNAVSGGITNAATAFATSGVGQYLGLSTAGQAMGPPTAAGAMGYTSSGATMTGSGNAAVASAGWVAAIVAAIYSGFQMQKGGWFNDNSRQGYLAEINEVATKWRSNNDRLFGMNRNISFDATGLSGKFDLAGFEGQSFQDKSQKGGTFRKDKRWTEYGEVGKGLDAYLDSLLKSTVSGLQTIGKTLNVESTKALEGFSHQFALQLSDNGDMSKAGEKIAGEISKVSDELVTRLVPTIGEFAQFGESATQTFQRLNQEVQATDAILLAMGKSASDAFGGVGLASIAAREDLIALAGGLDKLAGKTQSYYQAFYSADEQAQRAADQARGVLISGFADLDQAIPASKEAFRALVESQDLSTDSGRKLFNALLDLSDEFDTVSKVSGSALDKLKQATTTAQQGQASLFDTFASDAQKLEAAKKLVSDTFASIGESVPKDAAAFLALAQSIDPATEAGQGLIAALSKVSNAFAYTQTAAITAAEAATAAINNARNTSAQAFFQQIDFRSAADGYVNDGQAAIDKLFGSINAGAIESAQLAASAAADASQAWKSASQSIKSALDNIRTGSLSGLSPESRYRMLQSQFAATSAAAQSGDKEAAGKLGQIATDFLEASRDYNASSEAFQADRAAADTALSKSLSYASSQVSLQDTIAKASQASAAHLQSLNDTLTGFSAKALELLQKSYGGADRGTASNAVDKLAEAQASFDDWFKTTKAGDSKGYGNGTLTRLGDNFAQLTVGGNTWYVRAAESLLEVGKRIEAVRDQVKLDFGINLPSYAVGTPYVPEDQIAQIHQGEMIIPASAAAQLRKYGMGNQVDSGLQAEILAELRATRQGQQQSYSAMQQQLAASNSKLATVERRLAAMEDQARLQRAGS